MLQKVPTAQTLSNGADKLRWSRQELKLWPPQLSFMTSRFTTQTQRMDKQTFLGLFVIMTWIFKQMELANVFQFCNWTLVINQSGDEFSVAQIGHSFMWKYYSSSCCSRHCKRSRCAQQHSGRVFLHFPSLWQFGVVHHAAVVWVLSRSGWLSTELSYL